MVQEELQVFLVVPNLLLINLVMQRNTKTRGPSSVDDDDDTRGGDGMPLRTTWLSKSRSIHGSNEVGNTTTSRITCSCSTMQTMDLNRIAYRFMADGGFLDDEIDENGLYGLEVLLEKLQDQLKKLLKESN